MIVLDAKTDYSFMRGYGTPEQWLARCKEIGVTHLGVADYCSTWGHTFFRKAFKDSGVKLLYGVQLPVVIALDKDPRHSLVTLIAKKDVKPLYDLVTLANKQSYYRPRITWDQLKGYEGIIIVDFLLPHHVKRVTPTMLAGVEVEHEKLKRAPCYGPRYPSPETRQGFNLMQAISSGQRIGEVGGDALHMLRASEFKSRFTGEFIDLADVVKETDRRPPQGHADRQRHCGQGRRASRARYELALRAKGLLTGGKKKKAGWKFKDPAYEERLNRELKVIVEKGFEDYFFFVGDIVAMGSRAACSWGRAVDRRAARCCAICWTSRRSIR
jgi:DNA polymerase III alpha subunit